MARPTVKDAVSHSFSIPRKVSNFLKDNRTDPKVREISEWITDRLIYHFELSEDTSLAKACNEYEQSKVDAEKAIRRATTAHEIYLAMVDLNLKKKGKKGIMPTNELPEPDFDSSPAQNELFMKELSDYQIEKKVE